MEALIFRPPTLRTRHFGMRAAPRIPKSRVFDSQSPICQRPGMERTASSFKLRANAPEGRKAISYQLFCKTALQDYANISRIRAFARFDTAGFSSLDSPPAPG